MTNHKLNGELEQQIIKETAGETLGKFKEIAEAANKELQNGPVSATETLANPNTWTNSKASQNLSDISKEVRDSLRKLSQEPAIARVVVVDEDSKKQTYYICRTSPVSSVKNLASYRALKGRLASLPVGDEFTLPDGSIVTVSERAELGPEESKEGWDSIDTIMETEAFEPSKIKSLRSLLAETDTNEDYKDLLGKIEAEDKKRANIYEGVRRSIIKKMGLRDQPILDQYQDEIFRLPLNNRLLILGPPGTGKTTTLIRRLGQKLDVNYLEPKEKNLIKTVVPSQSISHKDRWLMFTPTELLRQYLKEAFAREGVPASDQKIRTWHDYRLELARNKFGVLKTASGGGMFVLIEQLASLQDNTINQSIKWYDDFNAWQLDTYKQGLLEATRMLRESKKAEARSIGERLENILKVPDSNLAYLFKSLANELSVVKKLLTSLKDFSETKIKYALNLQLKNNSKFLDEMGNFIDELQQKIEPEIDEQDEFDADNEEEEDQSIHRTPRGRVIIAYKQAMRAHARATAAKRKISNSSKNGKIIEWLGDRGLKEEDCIEVGESLLLQTSARRFENSVKRFIDDVSKRYKAFRRVRQNEGRWYKPKGFEASHIHPLELDIILLSILKSAGNLLSQGGILRNIDQPIWSSLQLFLSNYQNQILVDEATDFSPIQLACMAELTHPNIRSFFACGDFNQRLTEWGARSTEDLKWIFPDFDIKKINISYRHTKRLNDLARALIKTVGGTEQQVSLPAQADSEGVVPVLLEHAENDGVIIEWLVGRILEIERFVSELPSTAIFVNNENNVSTLASALKTGLEKHNIQVTACREGQAVGQESSVRVFDVQHIKGLEFEAVFFVGIDQLANELPKLFDKFLYVGITRAANYLGITCKNTLPSKVETLRKHFGKNWQ